MSTRSIARPVGAIAAFLMWLWLGQLSAIAQSQDYDQGAPDSSFSELDRYGTWRQHPEWGTVWAPDVSDDWRPYTVGRWVYTEENGWYWDSEEPFGWAVYHYGRWIDDPDDGWIWIPGTEWGPAWVAWRYGDDVIGWAPLPPEAVWDPDRGVVISESFYSSPRYAPYWIFLAPRFMTMPSLHRHVFPYSRNPDAFYRTRPATLYGFDNRRVFNHGIRPGDFERLANIRIAPTRLMPSNRPGIGRRDSSGVSVFRPNIVTSDRWRSGRSGDWRKFEPTRRDSVRQQGTGDRGRRDFVPETGRGADRSRRDFTPPDNSRRDPREFQGRGDGRERVAPSNPGFNRIERVPETRAEPRLAPRQSDPPVQREFRREQPAQQAPQREFRQQPRQEGRRGGGGGEQRGFNPPPQQPRQQVAPPPPQQRAAPPPAAQVHKAPPPPDQNQAPPGGGATGGRRGGQ